MTAHYGLFCDFALYELFTTDIYHDVDISYFQDSKRSAADIIKAFRAKQQKHD